MKALFRLYRVRDNMSTEARCTQASFGLVVAEAFVRGIRHIGYKSNIEALAELVDNSIQAYAERIDFVLGYADGGSSAKPEQLAVIDDGHGMSRICSGSR